MLEPCFQTQFVEAGCDEAGRGCLAGPVFAAAVIFPSDYTNEILNDSKTLTEKNRELLRTEIKRDAICYQIAQVNPAEIDRINIHNASYLAMHKALEKLNTLPEFIIVDGNKFIPYKEIPHKCIVKGDALYLSIAAASILAKTARDDYMRKIHEEFPQYDWAKNKGYPTKAHRIAILEHGSTIYHRKTFKVTDPQLKLL